MAAQLKPIYRAATAEQAAAELEAFISRARVIPFFAFPPEIRKVIYTTNAVEPLHRSLRKIIKNLASLPNEESAIKLLYLALRNESAKWNSVQSWRQTLNQFEILWGNRLRLGLGAAA